MIASIEEQSIPAERLADVLPLGSARLHRLASTKTYDPEKGNDNQMSL